MLGPCTSRNDDGNYCCCQFYLNGNLGLKWKRLEKRDNCFFVHAPLNLNLAKPDNDYMTKILDNMLNEIYPNKSSLVLHVGKVGSWEMVTERLNEIKIQSSLLSKSLLLENAAGQGSEIGRKSFELRRIFEALDNTNNIGVCLDTQHAFAGGLASFKDHESVVRLFEKIESFTKIGLIHLNDSKTDYKSHVDRHAPLGQGKIWSENTGSLKTITEYCQERNIYLISETGDYFNDLKFIQELK
jgi:deoxyribonuclease-4